MDVLDLYSSPPCYKAPPIKDQYYPCYKVPPIKDQYYPCYKVPPIKDQYYPCYKVPPIKDQYYPCYKVPPIKDQYYLLGLITFKCNRLHYNYFAIFMITLHYDYINFQM